MYHPGSNQTENIASATRTYRRLHKWVAVPLFIFLFLIGATGLLLGWKKQLELTPTAQTGTRLIPGDWIGLDSIYTLAQQFAADSLTPPTAVDRIEVRPSKGMAKVTFETDYTEWQIDLATGKTLNKQKRWNDLIEHIHDGTIIDRLLGNSGEHAKISYTSLTSLGLILLAFSGFWLWRNPRRIRKIKRI